METIQRVAIPLATIDPMFDDQSDLEPLVDLIGRRRAVMMGEATHGSGSDFLAKTRIIRFLHERLGFDLVAFESPAYGMRLASEGIFSGSLSARSAFERGAFGHYAVPVQMAPFFAYLEQRRTTSRPLRVAGLDNQFLGRGQLAGFPQDLASLLETRDISSPFRSEESPERTILESLSVVAFRRGESAPPSPAERTQFLNALGAVQRALLEGRDDESRTWARLLEGTACHARRVFRLVDGGGELSGRCARNSQMALHALWLLESDPEVKIVFWVHNGHVMHDQPPGRHETTEVFGNLMRHALGEDVYTMITTSFEGTFGFASAAPTSIMEDQVPDVELEELLATAGWPAAIVPLSSSGAADSWLSDRFFARPVGYETESQPWADQADAFLFVRTQEKSAPPGE